MSETIPPDRPEEEEEPEGAAYVDKDERGRPPFGSPFGGAFGGAIGVPFADLPPAFQAQIERQRIGMELQVEVRKLVDKQTGLVESKLLPEFTNALQQDYRVTNRDALRAQHAAQSILNKADEMTHVPTYWANIHMLRYVAAMLLLEAETQEATALLQEEKLPGTTTEIENIQLPGAE